MTVHDALLERVKRANPAPPSHPVDTVTLRRLVDDRLEMPRRIARGPLVAVLVALALFAVVIPLVLFRDDPGPVVTETTAPAPTTTPTTVPATTTTAPTTTTAAVPLPPATISWTRVDDAALSITDLYLTGVATSNGTSIATGAIWSDDTMTGVILVSPDGETWSQVEDPSLASSNVVSVAARGEVVVAAGLTGTETINANGFTTTADLVPAIWRSADSGATWESIPIDGEGVMYTVLATDEGFIAAGDGIWISDDGTAWRKVGDKVIIWGLAQTPTGFVAAGQRFSPSAATIWTSPDGETWERAKGDGDSLAQGPGNVAYLKQVATSGDTTIAVGTHGSGAPGDPFNASVWRSVAGSPWERLPRDPVVFGGGTWVQMNAIVDADGLWVAVGARSDESRSRVSEGRVWVSEDGIEWFRLENAEDVLGRYGGVFAGLENLIWDGDRLVAVGPYSDGSAVWIGTIER